MLLYKTTYQIKDEEKQVITYQRWDGSAKDAGSERKKIRQRHGFIPNSVQTQKIVLPADKKGFLRFLNEFLLK